LTGERPNPQLKFTDKLAYLDREGDGLPIVFLHGSGFSKEVFENQFKSDALAGHRLIALDLPGHGQSKDADNAQDTYTYSGFAKEVLEFIEETKLVDCIVAGWSLGGQVALEMIDSAPQISGIVAFGAAPAANGPLGLIQSMHFSKTLLLAGKAEFTMGEARNFEEASLGAHADGRFIETLKRTDRKMRPSVARSLLYRYGTSQKARLENSATPVCLLHGRNEPLIRTSYMETLSNPMLYGGKTSIIENAAHAPFLEAQSEFDGHIKGFADAVSSGELISQPLELALAS